MLMMYMQMLDTPAEKAKFEEIYLAYRGMMFNIANGILRNEEDAEDAVHNAFLWIIKNFSPTKFFANRCPQTPLSSVYIISPTIPGSQGGDAMNDMWELDAPSEGKKLEEIYRLYQKTMRYVALGILQNEHLAEDAVQEGILRIAANLSKIARVDSRQTKAYVSVIVRNAALTILNDMHRQVFTDNIDALAYSESNTETSILNQMRYKEVVSAIRTMPEGFSEILDLYYIQGFKVTEISERTGLNREVVKKRIQRGKKKLLELLPWDRHIP